MTIKRTLYLFGDQTFDIRPHIPDLLSTQESGNASVNAFLSSAHDAISDLLKSLPPKLWRNPEQFSSIQDIARWRQQGKHFLPLEMALTCLYQLLQVLRQHKSQRPYAAKPRDSLIMSVCLGAFAAAAVSCSRRESDLITLGIEAIKACFRVGVLIATAAKKIEPETATRREWAMVIFGPRAAQIVSAFVHDCNLAQEHQPYISAVLPGGVTVSGPPSALDMLHVSRLVVGHKVIPLAVYGPANRPLLYSRDEITKIVSAIRPLLTGRRNSVPVLLGKGSVSTNNSFSRLIHSACEDVLFNPISTPNIIDGARGWLSYIARSLDDPMLARKIISSPISMKAFGMTESHIIYREVATLLCGQVITPDPESISPMTPPRRRSSLFAPSLPPRRRSTLSVQTFQSTSPKITEEKDETSTPEKDESSAPKKDESSTPEKEITPEPEPESDQLPVPSPSASRKRASLFIEEEMLLTSSNVDKQNEEAATDGKGSSKFQTCGCAPFASLGLKALADHFRKASGETTEKTRTLFGRAASVSTASDRKHSATQSVNTLSDLWFKEKQ